jgi:hypothetical protein
LQGRARRIIRKDARRSRLAVNGWEQNMNKSQKASRAWVKPQVTRLGDVKDVAGSVPTGPQGGGTKS